MFELNLKNLSSKEVIDVLSELCSMHSLTEIVQIKLRDHKVADETIIKALIEALSNKVNSCHRVIN